MKSSLKEQEEITESLSLHDLYGRFSLEAIYDHLNQYGITKGLPANSQEMDYKSLDLNSIRFVNRVLRYTTSQKSVRSSKKIKRAVRKISNKDVTNIFYNDLKPFIKKFKIEDEESKSGSRVEYIRSKDFVEFFREKYISLEKKDLTTSKMMRYKARIISDLTLSQNLLSFLSSPQSLVVDGVIVKKFMTLVREASRCEYFLAVGCSKRPDPREHEDILPMIEEESSQRGSSQNILRKLDQEKVKVVNSR